MDTVIQIRRRLAGGAAGPPASLENAELAYNENDHTLYYGAGEGGPNGSATSIIAIGGSGAFATIGSVGSGGSSTLAGLSDVSVAGMSSGSILNYNASSSKFEFTNITDNQLYDGGNF